MYLVQLTLSVISGGAVGKEKPEQPIYDLAKEGDNRCEWCRMHHLLCAQGIT